jgi:hypothetical protein
MQQFKDFSITINQMRICIISPNCLSLTRIPENGKKLR